MRLVDTLWRDLQLVLEPEHILAPSLRMWMCRPEERLELGCRDNLPQAAGRAQKVVSVPCEHDDVRSLSDRQRGGWCEELTG